MTESDAGSNVIQEAESHPQKKQTVSGISLSIWPPTQRTRDAVINRLIETLSSPSILSKRYGIISHLEAEDAARKIEEEAFGVANGGTSAEDDGLEILQLYSKEISKRMLETVKARAKKQDSTASNDVSEIVTPAEQTDVSSEEKSSAVGSVA